MLKRLADVLGLIAILVISQFPNAAWGAAPSPSPSPAMQCVGDVCVPVPRHPKMRCIVDAFYSDGPIACVPIESPSPSPTPK